MKKRKTNSSSLDATKVIADSQKVKKRDCDSLRVLGNENITCMQENEEDENEVYYDTFEGSDILYDTLNEIDIFLPASSGDECGINSDFVLFEFNDSDFVITVDAPKKCFGDDPLPLFASDSEIQANIKVSEVILHGLKLIKQRKSTIAATTTTKRVFGVDLPPLSVQLSTMQSNVKAGENNIHEMYLERREQAKRNKLEQDVSNLSDGKAWELVEDDYYTQSYSQKLQ